MVTKNPAQFKGEARPRGVLRLTSVPVSPKMVSGNLSMPSQISLPQTEYELLLELHKRIIEAEIAEKESNEGRVR